MFFGLDGVINKHDDLGESVRSESNSVLSSNKAHSCENVTEVKKRH